MKKFFNEIKERKIRKWLAIFVSTGITTIGIVHLISFRYNLPSFIFDVVFFTIVFGIPGTILIAWFHGKEGAQKIKSIEYVLHSILFILLIITLYFRLTSPTIPQKSLDERVVAVLPFSNFNETTETDFIADGITDDILNQLSKISELKIISRTSVMKYKNTNKNISEISNELGSGSILEGSIRTSDNKIRIVAQLIDASNDVHIWSETFDRELKDIFEIQSDIAERIAASLHAKLLPLEKEQINRKETENLEAYTFYLQGKHLYYNYTKEDNEKAIEFFKRALSVDPNYALAIADLANAYGQKVTKYWDDEKWIDSSLTLSKKAVELNPNLAEGYKALAFVYHYKKDLSLALINYEKAIELNPNYWTAMLNYGQMKMSMGFYDESLYWIRRANELAPNDIMGTISVSMVYTNLNCDSTAAYWAKQAWELDKESIFTNYFLGDLYLNNGNTKNAKFYFDRARNIDSNWVLLWFLGARLETVLKNNQSAIDYFDKYMDVTQTAPEYYYAYLLQQIGKVDSANIILNEEVADYDKYFKKGIVESNYSYLAFAEIYSLLNEKEKSLLWLEKAIDNGYTDVSRVKLYPYMNNIKKEKGYIKLIQKMETKIDSFQTETKNKYPLYFNCK